MHKCIFGDPKLSMEYIYLFDVLLNIIFSNFIKASSDYEIADIITQLTTCYKTFINTLV